MTEVKQTYSRSLNLSVSVKDGQVTKITKWTTGEVGSTERLVFIRRK
jgi:hypothetical protein